MRFLIFLAILNVSLTQAATDSCKGLSNQMCQIQGCCYTKIKIWGDTEVETCADPSLQTPSSTRELACTELADRTSADTWTEVQECKCGDPNQKEEAVMYSIYGTSGIAFLIFLCCLYRCVSKKCKDGKSVEPLTAFNGSETTQRKASLKSSFSTQKSIKGKQGDVLLKVVEFKKTSKKGKISFKNGDVYIGEVTQTLKKQIRSGQGIMNYKNKDVYNGKWKENKRHGQGTQTYDKLKKEFKGTWENGQQIKGKLINKNPLPKDTKLDFKNLKLGKQWLSYDGEVKKSLYHGKGTITLCNGDKYQGEFKMGKIDKKSSGKLTAANKTYTGTWKEIQKELQKYNQSKK